MYAQTISELKRLVGKLFGVAHQRKCQKHSLAEAILCQCWSMSLGLNCWLKRAVWGCLLRFSEIAYFFRHWNLNQLAALHLYLYPCEFSSLKKDKYWVFKSWCLNCVWNLKPKKAALLANECRLTISTVQWMLNNQVLIRIPALRMCQCWRQKVAELCEPS